MLPDWLKGEKDLGDVLKIVNGLRCCYYSVIHQTDNRN